MNEIIHHGMSGNDEKKVVNALQEIYRELIRIEEPLKRGVGITLNRDYKGENSPLDIARDCYKNGQFQEAEIHYRYYKYELDKKESKNIEFIECNVYLKKCHIILGNFPKAKEYYCYEPCVIYDIGHCRREKCINKKLDSLYSRVFLQKKLKFEHFLERILR